MPDQVNTIPSIKCAHEIKSHALATRKPEVTVVIPTRNRWSLAERAVRCALEQRDVAVEVLVVDDGSEEPPPAGLARAQLEVVRLAAQAGVAGARNVGIARAATHWIAFLDDDDVWAPERLRRLIDEAELLDAQFAYSAALVVDCRLKPLMLQPAPPPEQLVHLLHSGNAIPGGGSGVVASTTLLERAGRFDEAFSYLADWELWWRLAQNGHGAAVSAPLVAYVLHAGSWALRGDPAVLCDFHRLVRKHPEISIERSAYERHVGYCLHLSGRRRAAARVYLAAGAPAHALRALAGRHLATRIGLERPPPATPAWLSRYRSPNA